MSGPTKKKVIFIRKWFFYGHILINIILFTNLISLILKWIQFLRFVLAWPVFDIVYLVFPCSTGKFFFITPEAVLKKLFVLSIPESVYPTNNPAILSLGSISILSRLSSTLKYPIVFDSIFTYQKRVFLLYLTLVLINKTISARICG